MYVLFVVAVLKNKWRWNSANMLSISLNNIGNATSSNKHFRLFTIFCTPDKYVRKYLMGTSAIRKITARVQAGSTGRTSNSTLVLFENSLLVHS